MLNGKEAREDREPNADIGGEKGIHSAGATGRRGKEDDDTKLFELTQTFADKKK